MFVKRSRIQAPAERVFAFHEHPDALERLTPPWERVEVIERTGGIRDGGRVVLRARIGPFLMRWVAEHRDYIAGRQFCDVQVEGPFAYWVHTHGVEPDGADACFLEDRVEYALPFGWLGQWLGGWLVRRKLARLFAYRHRVTENETTAHTQATAGAQE